MIYVNARVRQFVLVVAVVLAGGLLLVLPKSINTGHAAHSPLPTLTVVCLPMLGGDLSLTDAGYVLDGSGGATLHLGLQNQDVVELTRISFSAQGWDPVAPSHGAVVSGLLGDHLVSWYTPAGRLTFTPDFGGYWLGATERFTFTVQGFVPSEPIQLTVRKGENLAETHTFDLNAPDCDHTPAPFSPLPTPTPTPLGFTLPTEPVVPMCVFTPPPGSIPDEPVVPLSAYTFSPPQVVVTNTAPLGIQQWLPDSKTILITRFVDDGSVLELLNTSTREITRRIGPDSSFVAPRWLPEEQTAFWLELGSRHHVTEPGLWLQSFNPAGKRRLSESGLTGGSITHDVSPNGKEFVFMSSPGGTQPLIWNQESKTLRALPVDLAAWRYENGPIYPFQPFNVNWHPAGDKILFWGGTWVFLYDLITNRGCEIDMGGLSPRLSSVHEAAWSPNGRYLLLKVAEDPPYTTLHGPFDRVMILDTHSGIAVHHSLGTSVWNLVWSSDNQTIAMIGETEQEISIPEVGLVKSQGVYLLNIHNGDSLHVLLDYFVGGSPGLVWSPDGTRLAFLGALLEGFGTANHRGGLFMSRVTLNP